MICYGVTWHTSSEVIVLRRKKGMGQGKGNRRTCKMKNKGMLKTSQSNHIEHHINSGDKGRILRQRSSSCRGQLWLPQHLFPLCLF